MKRKSFGERGSALQMDAWIFINDTLDRIGDSKFFLDIYKGKSGDVGDDGVLDLLQDGSNVACYPSHYIHEKKILFLVECEQFADMDEFDEIEDDLEGYAIHIDELFGSNVLEFADILAASYPIITPADEDTVIAVYMSFHNGESALEFCRKSQFIPIIQATFSDDIDIRDDIETEELSELLSRYGCYVDVFELTDKDKDILDGYISSPDVLVIFNDGIPITAYTNRQAKVAILNIDRLKGDLNALIGLEPVIAEGSISKMIEDVPEDETIKTQSQRKKAAGLVHDYFEG